MSFNRIGGDNSSTAYTNSSPTPSASGKQQDGRKVTSVDGPKLPSLQSDSEDTPSTLPKVKLRSRSASSTEPKSFLPSASFKPFSRELTLDSTEAAQGQEAVDILDEMDSEETGTQPIVHQRHDADSGVDKAAEELILPLDSNDNRPDATSPDQGFLKEVESPLSDNSQNHLSHPSQSANTPAKNNAQAAEELFAAPKKNPVNIEDVKPAPPLTPEQEEEKASFKDVFKGLFHMVGKNKNIAAMAFGGALCFALCFTPAAPVGVAIGFTIFMVGFANAMYDEESVPAHSPTPQFTPDINKPEKSKEEDKSKSEKAANTDSAKASASPSNVRAGKFHKIDTTPDPLQYHHTDSRKKLNPNLRKVDVDNQPLTPGSDDDTNEALRKLEPQSISKAWAALAAADKQKTEKQLSELFSDMAAHHCAASGMKMTPELSSKMAASLESLKNMNDLVRSGDWGKHADAVQNVFQTLIDDSGANSTQLGQLHNRLQDMRKDLDIPADIKGPVSALLDALADIIKTSFEKMPPPEISDVKPDSPSARALTAREAAIPPKITQQELAEKMGVALSELSGVPGQSSFMIFQDKMCDSYRNMMEASKAEPAEFLQAWNNVISDAIDVIKGCAQADSFSGPDFKTALSEVVGRRNVLEQQISSIALKNNWFNQS